MNGWCGYNTREYATVWFTNCVGGGVNVRTSSYSPARAAEKYTKAVAYQTYSCSFEGLGSLFFYFTFFLVFFSSSCSPETRENHKRKFNKNWITYFWILLLFPWWVFDPWFFFASNFTQNHSLCCCFLSHYHTIIKSRLSILSTRVSPFCSTSMAFF